ncbi:MAG: polysaccharide biosynthesis protein, partial [Cyclobacteriaceae bacterium]|nr:polysaccharide biosynthesis protein [Cyclobacteriaceae bacterium]
MEFFKSLKIVPRWLIILIDAVIISHAAFFAYFVRFNFQLGTIDRFQFLPSVMIFTVLAVMAMLISKSYVGIVRHTGTGDLSNMMKMLFVTNVLLWSVKLANSTFGLYDSTLFLPFSVALIASTLAFPLMIGYRLMVKEIFYYMNNRYKKPNRKVAIYGAGEAGILTFNALKNTSDSEWIPVAFIDDDLGKEGKLIEGKRIFYSVEGLKKAVDKLGVQEVVIAINSLSIARQREIIDACLDLGLPSKIIPPAKDWF